MKVFLSTIFMILLAMSAAAQDYSLGVGDKLEVKVLGEQDLSFAATVRPDGKITVPQVGDVLAAGLSSVQLAERLTKEMKTLVRKPTVTVTVVEGQNDKVFVTGSGVKASVFELSRHKTLLQVLASIQDLSVADLSQASLVRDNNVLVKDLKDLYELGDLRHNVELRSGDVIVLPVLKDRYVYVSGAVNRPKTLTFRDGMTVLDAIMEAEGFNKFASKNDTKIVRRNGEKEEVIYIKGKKLLESGDSSQNIGLRRGDMVIVEEGFF